MSASRLIYITDRTSLPGDAGLIAVLERLLAAGLRSVYLREKDVAPNCFINLAREISTRCEAAGASLILPANAPLLDEFPQAQLQATVRTQVPGALKHRWGGDRRVGYSAHSLDEAIRAEDQGADYLFFSPIFDTQTHPGFPAHGIDGLRDVCSAVRIPVYALGGIIPDHTVDCLKAGSFGVAAVSALQGPQGESHCRRFLQYLS